MLNSAPNIAECFRCCLFVYEWWRILQVSCRNNMSYLSDMNGVCGILSDKIFPWYAHSNPPPSQKNKQKNNNCGFILTGQCLYKTPDRGEGLVSNVKINT